MSTLVNSLLLDRNFFCRAEQLEDISRSLRYESCWKGQSRKLCLWLQYLLLILSGLWFHTIKPIAGKIELQSLLPDIFDYLLPLKSINSLAAFLIPINRSSFSQGWNLIDRKWGPLQMIKPVNKLWKLISPKKMTDEQSLFDELLRVVLLKYLCFAMIKVLIISDRRMCSCPDIYLSWLIN